MLRHSGPVRSLWTVSNSIFFHSVWTRKNSTPCLSLLLSQHQSKYSSASIHTTHSFFQWAYSFQGLFDHGDMFSPLELQVTCHHVSAQRKQQLTYPENNKNQQSSVHKPLTVFNSIPGYSRGPENHNICLESILVVSRSYTALYFLAHCGSCYWVCLNISLEFASSKSIYTESVGRFTFKLWDYIQSQNIHRLISWHLLSRFLWKTHQLGYK